jgi:hypothetical protein
VNTKYLYKKKSGSFFKDQNVIPFYNGCLHFDEDGAEGQEAAEECDHQGLGVPLLLGNGSRDGVDAARVVGLTVDGAAEQRANQIARQYDEHTNGNNRQLF